MKYTLFISDYRRIILSFLRLFSFDLSSCGLWEEEVKTTAGGESFVRHWIIKVNAQEFWLISSAQSRQLKIWLISSAQSPQFKSNGWLRIWLISSDQESSLFRTLNSSVWISSQWMICSRTLIVILAIVVNWISGVQFAGGQSHDECSNFRHRYLNPTK